MLTVRNSPLRSHFTCCSCQALFPSLGMKSVERVECEILGFVLLRCPVSPTGSSIRALTSLTPHLCWRQTGKEGRREPNQILSAELEMNSLLLYLVSLTSSFWTQFNIFSNDFNWGSEVMSWHLLSLG